MVGLGEITGALTGIKTAFDIAKGLDGLRRDSDIQSAVSEIQAALMEAQIKAIEAHERHAALLQQVRDLETDIARLKTWDTEKQRYKLTKCGRGMVTYVLKRTEAGDEPGHALCPACYQRGEKNILQSNNDPMSRTHAFVCPSCKTALNASQQSMPEFAD